MYLRLSISLQRWLNSQKVGSQVTLRVWRDPRRLSLTSIPAAHGSEREGKAVLIEVPKATTRCSCVSIQETPKDS